MNIKCMFCGNNVDGDMQEWNEIKALIGFVNVWPSIPDWGDIVDCDKCWLLRQRIKSYGDGEILVRDKDWNWTTIREKDPDCKCEYSI